MSDFYRFLALILVFTIMTVRWWCDWLYGSIRIKQEEYKHSWLVFIGQVFFGGSFFLQAVGFNLLPMSINDPANTMVRIMGIFLIVLAGFVSIWARLARRSTWGNPCESPKNIKDHFLATNGPYRLIRHPFYASCIVGIAGIELSLASYFLFVIVPAYILAVIRMVECEEKQLRDKYDQKFLTYQERSWKLLPFIY